MESRAKAGTGNIINSLKGLYLQPLQRLFAFASAEFTPAFYGATKSSDKEHLSDFHEAFVKESPSSDGASEQVSK